MKLFSFGVFLCIFFIMATIQDVAEKAGVSKATVSRVLNNTAIVNSETREKILKVIEELHFTPSYLAKGMRKQNTRTIGIIVPNFSNLYYSEFLTHVEKEIRKSDYTSIICSLGDETQNENEYITRLVEGQQIEGLILCWYIVAEEDRDFLEKLSRKLPVVLMDESSEGLPLSSVYSDQYTGLKKLVEHLIEKGHQRIALIKSLKKYSIGELRFEGYKDALQDKGIEYCSELVAESDWTVSGGYNACRRLFENNEKNRPTAIIGSSDLIAIGALMYLYELKLSIPEDIAIAGYDDIPLAKAVYPPLTTVHEKVQEKAETAVKLLIAKIENRRKRNKEVVLDTQLILRDST